MQITSITRITYATIVYHRVLGCNIRIKAGAYKEYMEILYLLDVALEM